MNANFLQDVALKGNIYKALIIRLMVVMVLFSLCRLGFYLFNTAYFPGMSAGGFARIMLGGLKFDLAAVLYVNALFILLNIIPFNFRFNTIYQNVLKYIFIVTNGVALASNISDFVYYKFTLRRTTSEVFQQFQNETNIGGLIIQFFIDYWYAVLIWVILLVAMSKVYNLVTIRGPQIKNRIAYYALGLAGLILIAYFFAVGIRGGFRHSTRPITLSNAGEFVEDPNEVSIVLNTPFAIIRTLGKDKIKKSNYFESKEELESIYTPLHVPDDTAVFSPQNVVVIILESFSKEFFGVFNKDKENGTYQGYTPFLDSLVGNSLTFEYSLANGRKSIDGLPSVIASIPSLSIPHVLTPFASNRINSIGSLLGEKGYHTSFFHGAPNGSMGFSSFTNVAGIENYYGMSEYGNDDDFDGLWGIWDHKFLDYYAKQLTSFPKPFASVFFSVSSHHPFLVPEEFEGQFKGGDQPILKCIEYTDYALKKFFEKISGEEWYTNTLFVITADHVSSNYIFPESRTTWGSFSIPIIFFKPDNSLAEFRHDIVEQIDILPTVLGQLNYDKPYIAFGRDVTDSSSEGFAFNYRDTYSLLQGDYLLQFDGKETISLYNFKEDAKLEHNLKAEFPDIVSRMELKVKAIIQQYNNRMIENRLTPESQ
jgi:hypothetical protein